MTTQINRYILDNTQPTTCPKCGTRTNFFEKDETTQIHFCPSTSCLYSFVGEFESEKVDSIFK